MKGNFRILFSFDHLQFSLNLNIIQMMLGT